MKKNRFLCCFFILCAFITSAQNRDALIPLDHILNEISKEYTVTFSYADRDIQNLFVSKWNSKSSLKRKIKYLSKYLPLSFNKINKNSIAIAKKETLFTWCGTVLDELGAPIPNAIISYGSGRSLSNNEGFVLLNTDYNASSISIASTGFETVQFILKQNSKEDCIEIKLLKKYFSNVQLDEILLNDYITSGISKNRKGFIQIDYKNFGILPGLIESDVLLTAQALPSIRSVNERVSNLNIRGGTNDQNLLLWNGIKMYQSGHFFGLISAFNPETTQKATIYTNGTNAAYSDGVSGTIVMETNNKMVDSIQVSAGLNLLNANLTIDIPITKNSLLQIAARHSLNGIYQTPTYNSYFDQAFRNTEVLGGFDISIISDPNFNFFDTSLRFISNLSERTVLTANAILINNDLNFLEIGNIDEQISRRRSGVSQANVAGGLQLSHNWNEKYSSNVEIYSTNYTLESENTNFNSNQRLIQENDVLESSARIETTYIDNPSLQLKGGYQFTETGVRNIADVTNPFFRSDIKEVIRTNALYLEGDKSFSNGKGKAIIGLRANHFSELNENTIEPRAVVNYNISSGLTAEFKGELKSQVTSQVINLQNDFIGVDNRRWVLSNNGSIPILTSKQASFGLQYNQRDFLITAEYYSKRVDGITTQSQGFLNQLQFENFSGSYQVQGLDLLISKSIGAFNSSLSYSYALNNYYWTELPNSIATSFPNNNDIRHSFTGILDYSYKGVKIATSINWHTGKPFTPINPENPIVNGNVNFAPPNSATIDDFLRIDLSATYSFNVSDIYKGIIGVSLWNITNRRNELERLSVSTDDTTISNVSRLSLERTPNVSIKVTF